MSRALGRLRCLIHRYNCQSRTSSANKSFVDDLLATRQLGTLSVAEQSKYGLWSGSLFPEKAGYATQSRGTKVKVASKKRAPTGFAIYVKREFAEVKRKNTSISTTEVMKELAQNWHKLSDSEKIAYK